MAAGDTGTGGPSVSWWEWGLLGAPFPAMGALTGWLVGLSNSPVLASLLPLIFGLFGALGYGLLEKRSLEQGLREKLAGLDEAVRGQVEVVLGIQRKPLAMPVLWSVGVVLFCAACAGGVYLGLDTRLPKYEPMSQWVDGQTLQPDEGALLYGLRWKLQNAGVSETEAAELFGQVIQPVLALTDEQVRFDRLMVITKALNPADVHRDVAFTPSLKPDIPSSSEAG